MSRINDGGPAFGHGDHQHGGSAGMSLRDWFAGQAMAGYIIHLGAHGMHASGYVDECATESYAFADAMLKAREAAE